MKALVAETEAIINSRPLSVESLSNVNSEVPLSPSNLLTMKSDVIMPQPGLFNRLGLYSRRQRDEWSILMESFGPVREKNSFAVSKHDKNGT